MGGEPLRGRANGRSLGHWDIALRRDGGSWDLMRASCYAGLSLTWVFLWLLGLWCDLSSHTHLCLCHRVLPRDSMVLFGISTPKTELKNLLFILLSCLRYFIIATTKLISLSSIFPFQKDIHQSHIPVWPHLNINKDPFQICLCFEVLEILRILKTMTEALVIFIQDPDITFLMKQTWPWGFHLARQLPGKSPGNPYLRLQEEEHKGDQDFPTNSICKHVAVWEWD